MFTLDETMDAAMEFAIGEIVYLKDALHTDGCRPEPFVVLEQVLQRCHGGIQKLYLLSRGRGNVPEILLTRTEPEFRPRSDAEVTADIDRRCRGRRAEWVLDDEHVAKRRMGIANE